MRPIISFMHISLDGFVAGPAGEMNWITINEAIFEHVGRRIGLCDMALYGRTTYQMMEGYWPTAADKPNASEHDRRHSAWYKTVNKVVLSTTLTQPERTGVRVIASNLVEQLTDIKRQAGSEILLFGSPRATHALIQAGLIDGYWLFVNPVVLGKGIPLFGHVPERQKLKRTSMHAFESGVTELGFVVERT
jgi:dihydrofolate reductase